MGMLASLSPRVIKILQTYPMEDEVPQILWTTSSVPISTMKMILLVMMMALGMRLGSMGIESVAMVTWMQSMDLTASEERHTIRGSLRSTDHFNLEALLGVGTGGTFVSRVSSDGSYPNDIRRELDRLCVDR